MTGDSAAEQIAVCAGPMRPYRAARRVLSRAGLERCVRAGTRASRTAGERRTLTVARARVADARVSGRAARAGTQSLSGAQRAGRRVDRFFRVQNSRVSPALTCLLMKSVRNSSPRSPTPSLARARTRSSSRRSLSLALARTRKECRLYARLCPTRSADTHRAPTRDSSPPARFRSLTFPRSLPWPSNRPPSSSATSCVAPTALATAHEGELTRVSLPASHSKSGSAWSSMPTRPSSPPPKR